MLQNLKNPSFPYLENASQKTLTLKPMNPTARGADSRAENRGTKRKTRLLW